ncbi:hypothetical protein F5B22DRAFT_656950 [Xylaria bambusicola]|uniref:uncharacterized protein n=1 Tax=Xylaria bambusicola TaxID=326684 RepID=UPI0020088B58|nr:uncharacterized protein F5B22DRAFT_656950 [Xylaria bambusicola]KAI0513230.1 hypothetical protein F5B22DRAFT_656950 [Xylaria bambusicola]
MRASIITLGLAAAAQGAVIQARDSGCDIYLKPIRDQPSAPGEIIAYGSIGRWSKATGGGSATSAWVDYSGSLTAPYSFRYKANTIPGYETNAKIEDVLRNGWIGTYILGVDKPNQNDFLITGYGCK